MRYLTLWAASLFLIATVACGGAAMAQERDGATAFHDKLFGTNSANLPDRQPTGAGISGAQIYGARLFDRSASDAPTMAEDR